MNNRVSTYHRNTNSRFISVWMIALFLIITATILLAKGQFLPSIIVIGILILSGGIKIYGLTILYDMILVRRYTAFGFKRKDIAINNVNGDDVEEWEHGTIKSGPSTDSLFDGLFIPAIFLAGKKGMTFKKLGPASEIKSLRLYLSVEEYELIMKIINQRSGIK